MYKWYRLLPGCVWLASFAGCGLVSSDTATIDLSTLEKQFSIDATAWSVNTASTDTLIHRSCNPDLMPDPCASAAGSLNVCKANTCVSRCNGETFHCELALRVELWRAVNLPMELPELLSAAGDPSLAVTLDDLTYDVSLNSLNVDTAELEVYVAPATVMGPAGDGAQRIGIIPGIPSAWSSPPQGVLFTADGRDGLRRRLANYQVPFNLILASEMVVDLSRPIPVGRLNATLRMQGRAGR